MKAMLVLEDGSVYYGQPFGYQGKTAGEVVFNTGMTGYQEVLTDPSYAGQIVTMTYPLIGNYGFNSQDGESAKPQVKGFIVRETCQRPSNWRNEKTLDHYLAQAGIPGIAGVDTRALTRRLRNHGTMGGILATGEWDVQELRREIRGISLAGPHLVRSVTTPQSYVIPGDGYRVTVLDFGIKENILRMLKSYDCHLTVLPSWSSAEDVLATRPDGVFLSNGPGDPSDAVEGIAAVKELLGRLPLFGICLGHQITALALGAKVYKLKFGHRGANHPVQDLETKRVYITSQNHGYAIDEGSLDLRDVAVSHKNLNDGTVEGLRHRHLPVFTVQYHPEAAPGPEDSRYLFDRFMENIAASKGERAAG